MADDEDVRGPNGQFKKGHKPLSAGRPKGSKDKISRTVKEAMDAAAQELGGAEGSAGVFVKAGKKDIVAFAQMFARTIPLEVKSENTNVGPPLVVNILTVPAGNFLTREAVARLQGGGPLEPPALVVDNTTDDDDPAA